MVVVKDSHSKAIRAHALQSKSAKHPYAARKLCADLEEWGHGKVILKSDGEPAIRALLRHVAMKAGMSLRHSPVYTSKAQASVKRWHGLQWAQCRTFKAAIMVLFFRG